MELADDALRAAGWTVTRHERKTGLQAGGVYQTWIPPAGRRALRSRVEVGRYLAGRRPKVPAAGLPAAPLPAALRPLAPASAPDVAAATAGPAAIGAPPPPGRALRPGAWGPARAAPPAARFPASPAPSVGLPTGVSTSLY